MHLSENEGIEGNNFLVTGGLGFVGSNLCLELVRRGADEVRSLDARSSSPWSIDLEKAGVKLIQGSPVNTTEFLINPLLRSLEYDLPKISVDTKHALFMSRIIWVIYTLLYPWLHRRWLPGPLLLPAEVYKIGVTHYFSYLKAREELGYIPMVSPRDGLSATLSYWQERKRRELDGPTIFTWFLVLFGMFALFCAAFLPPVGPLKFVYALALFMFRSLWLTRVVFIAAVAAHVGEGIYAWYLARRVDPQNAMGWFWQTAALGIFSLRFLLKRAKVTKM